MVQTMFVCDVCSIRVNSWSRVSFFSWFKRLTSLTSSNASLNTPKAMQPRDSDNNTTGDYQFDCSIDSNPLHHYQHHQPQSQPHPNNHDNHHDHHQSQQQPSHHHQRFNQLNFQINRLIAVNLRTWLLTILLFIQLTIPTIQALEANGIHSSLTERLNHAHRDPEDLPKLINSNPFNSLTNQQPENLVNLFHRIARTSSRPYDVPQIECPSSEDGIDRFACPTADRMGRYRCIEDHVLCNGFYDCPNGEDENRMSCMFYKTTKAHLDVLADAMLRMVRG